MASQPAIELTSLPASRFLTEDPSSPLYFRFDTDPSRNSTRNNNVHAHEAPQALSAQIFPPWRRTLYCLMESPASSPGAFLVHVFITFLILLSALVTILETIPAFHSAASFNSAIGIGKLWFGLETSLVVLFSVEYVARCIAWSGLGIGWQGLAGWVFSFYGIIDLLSVLPYYIEILLRQDTSVFFRFSILRMFRLLRVFKPFRYNHTILLTIEVMYLSVRRSQHALLAISFFVVMVLTVFSTLLYFAERGTWDATLETFVNVDGDPTQFASIPAAAWFVIVTITTVGYGEITPRSFLGRLVTLPLLLFGLLFIALPSFVLGREFSLVWNEMGVRGAAGEGEHRKPEDAESLLPASQSYPQQTRPSPIELNAYPTSPNVTYSASRANRDLSNHKLAQNQTELSRQISELGRQVEELREMLGEFVQRDFDGPHIRRRERSDPGGGSKRRDHETRITGKGKERESERETDR